MTNRKYRREKQRHLDELKYFCKEKYGSGLLGIELKYFCKEKYGSGLLGIWHYFRLRRAVRRTRWT